MSRLKKIALDILEGEKPGDEGKRPIVVSPEQVRELKAAASAAR